MSNVHDDCERDRLSNLLYHLQEIVEQESTLRALMTELVTASDGEPRAAVLSRIEVEVVDHLGYHLNELREPLADELAKVYEGLGQAGTKE
jgi:hypothetical protein